MWRPYHEMNGDWFWWGGRYEGKYTTAALYKQIFDRMVKVHKLNNLIWVWSVDRPSQPGREFDKYYPGTKYLDILAIDIYGNDFNQAYYDGLIALSEGKPVTLAEVGNPPSPDILKKQPDWVYWVVWAGMTRGTSPADYDKLLNYPKALFLEDPAYVNGATEYRKECGLEPMKLNLAADFTGEWKLNECESTGIQVAGASPAPYKLQISRINDGLNIKAATISEYSDDEIVEQTIIPDGKDKLSTGYMNSTRIQNAALSVQKDSLIVDSKVTVTYGGNTRDIKSRDVWVVKKRGRKLSITQTSDSNPGEKWSRELIFDKQ
jgi:hypothetical protein